MDVRFLPEAHIERAANELLFAYGQKFGEVTAPPVPAEEILECHLRLSLDFADLREARVLGAHWQNDYNHRRPHSSLGYRTPAAYAATCSGDVTTCDRRASCASWPGDSTPLARLAKKVPTLITTST